MASKQGDGDRSQLSPSLIVGDEEKRKSRELDENKETLIDKNVENVGSQEQENIANNDGSDGEIDNDKRRITQLPNLQEESNSETEITLSSDIKFGSRSGTVHLNSKSFAPLSRGLQGPQVAVSALATTAVLEPKFWKEAIIDQIVDDGDTYYCESYKQIAADNKKITFLKFRENLVVQNTHQVFVNVEAPSLVGKFRSKDSAVLNLNKAIKLFFERHDAGILTSPVLNIAIWRDKSKKICKNKKNKKSSQFYIFDGQARNQKCEVSGAEEAAAKLIRVRDISGIFLIILEKSKIHNEYFMLYGVEINKVQKLPENLKVDEEEDLKKGKGGELKKSKKEEVKKNQEEELKKTEEEDLKKIKEEELKKTEGEDLKKIKEEELKKTEEEDLKKIKEEELKKTKEEDLKKEDDSKKTKEQDSKKAKKEDLKKPKEEDLKKTTILEESVEFTPRPSAYKILSESRSVLQASYHLNHEKVPQELKGRGHLAVSLTALIYSKLLSINKWRRSLLDLMLDQAHIYLIDLARVLEKEFNDTFNLQIKDLLSDVILGIFSTKIKVESIIPDKKKKGKTSLEAGITEFFENQTTGILEFKKSFYPIWKEGTQFCVLDPFACNSEGNRIIVGKQKKPKGVAKNPKGKLGKSKDKSQEVEKVEEPKACVIVTNSIKELVETILKNTNSKAKDPFFIHGFQVLYIKTSRSQDLDLVSNPGSFFNKVIYRDETARRKPPVPAPAPNFSDECKTVMDMVPRKRPGIDKFKDVGVEFPELMDKVEEFMLKEEELVINSEIRREYEIKEAERREGKGSDEEKSFGEEDTSRRGSRKSSGNGVDKKEDDTEANQETEKKEPNREATEKDPNQEDAKKEPNQEATEKDQEATEKVQEASSGNETKYSQTEEASGLSEEDHLSNIEEKYIKGYKIINPHRLILQGSKNCVSEEFDKSVRGRQGIVMAIIAIAQGRLKSPSEWRRSDIDRTVDQGDDAYQKTLSWIRRGSPIESEDMEQGEEDEDEEDEEEDEDDEEDDEDDDDDDYLKKPKSVPSHLDVSMLPEKLSINGNRVKFKRKLKITEGTANPLANLGEAFERYFQRHSELVVENKKLFYGIWSEEGKFYVFNPYGSDEEGWRIREHPASLVVTDTINELTDVFYGILEFNDPGFYFHFVEIESIQPNDKYVVANPTEVVEEEVVEKYVTKFLPITDEDLFEKEEEEETVMVIEAVEEVDEEEDEDDDDEEDEEEIDEDQEEEESEVESVISLEDPLLEVEERDQPDPPETLNLALITGAVEMEAETMIDREEDDDVKYEKLKSNFAGDFVLPTKHALTILQEAKYAIKSVPSLVSRFSIDSKLVTGEGLNLAKSKPTAGFVNVISAEEGKISRIIKLPPRKYLFSRVTPIGLTPIRAIDDDFIQDEELDREKEEECRKGKEAKEDNEVMFEEVPESFCDTGPRILPLGPVIRTPAVKEGISCPEKNRRVCKMRKKDKGDVILEKIACNTEDVLMEMLFPKEKDDEQETKEIEPEPKIIDSDKPKKKPPCRIPPEIIGFTIADDRKLAKINGNMSLNNKEGKEIFHFKACYYAAILCIIAKVIKDVDEFSGTMLDQFVLYAEKIFQQIGKLRYKPTRWFNNIEILDKKCDVLLKQIQYADPENWKADSLTQVLSAYLNKDQTGILVFTNSSYAFWRENNMFYYFDPYSCDKDGRAGEGFACLMQFCDLPTMIARIKENNGEAANKEYRLYSLWITHIEPRKQKKKSKPKRKSSCSENVEVDKETDSVCSDDEEEDNSEEESEETEEDEPEAKFSLMELPGWVRNEKREIAPFDSSVPGFVAIRNYNASAFEVRVVENDITRPELAPFRKATSSDNLDDKMIRRKVYDRRFKEHCRLLEPIDLCVMGWACVHDPIIWSVRTVKGLYEASKDYAFDSLLASEDTTVKEMTDGLLMEFNIANYTFRVVFAPLHKGELYATEGWNLSMSIKNVFATPIYTGAIIICGKSHIGVMKKDQNLFAWWAVRRTKNLRFITSEDMEEFLKLIVQEIDEPEKIEFLMRVVTISYAQKLEPDHADNSGMHEIMVPSTSLTQIHRKEDPSYNLEEIFQPVAACFKPTFLFGNVTLRYRDVVKEPKVKRCYFVALLALLVKRDIVQSPLPGMIDKVIQVGEELYKNFHDPKYHTEHILKNVTVMDRNFVFRDCASDLVEFKHDPDSGPTNFYPLVRKKLKNHFNTRTDGILHFSNCCYGFWYSRSTNRFYYLDPYSCGKNGKAISCGGRSCLFVFSTICDMVQQMCRNKFEGTTGFFIHDFHVESVSESPDNKCQEDPFWIYLDYHWSFRRRPKLSKKKKRTRETKPTWNHYIIEIPNLIYSVWGTIGAYDPRFGERAGKNQAAICVAILAMQDLSHPSQWNAAILDSAVICGDCYYTQSLKSSARKCSQHPNRFNLQTCFRISPRVWEIEYQMDFCGILYGSRNRKSLAEVLKLALEESPNLLLECKTIVLAICSREDGFYAADPKWTGPPLFKKDHGSVYVLRCRNMNSLVYALTKMLNTNQRLEFHVTPVGINFSQGGKGPKNKLRLDPVRTLPGETLSEWDLIPGTEVVPGADDYQRYRKNVDIGMRYGDVLENPPETGEEMLHHGLVSTQRCLNAWRKWKHRDGTENCESIKTRRIEEMSLSDSDVEDNFPRLLDFAAGSGRILTKKPIVDKRPAEPVGCSGQPSFILEESRNRFKKKTKEMRFSRFKKYRHRVPAAEDDSEQDELGHDRDNVGQEGTENEEMMMEDDQMIDTGNEPFEQDVNEQENDDGNVDI